MSGHTALSPSPVASPPPIRIALHQPDIAGNVGTILRMAACFDLAVDLIEPMGFAWSDRKLARAGMDYLGGVRVTRHVDWGRFVATRAGRIVLFTTAGAQRLPDARFRCDDTLLFGAESSGVPPHVHDGADARVRIPLRAGQRSLNIAVAAAIAVGEALRQLDGWP